MPPLSKIMNIKTLFKWYINPYYWAKPYFVSFVEEGIMNRDYDDYVGGRVEIWTQWSKYDIDEYRFLTNNVREFYEFRNKWEFSNLSICGLKRFKKLVERFNCNK